MCEALRDAIGGKCYGWFREYGYGIGYGVFTTGYGSGYEFNGIGTGLREVVVGSVIDRGVVVCVDEEPLVSGVFWLCGSCIGESEFVTGETLVRGIDGERRFDDIFYEDSDFSGVGATVVGSGCEGDGIGTACWVGIGYVV